MRAQGVVLGIAMLGTVLAQAEPLAERDVPEPLKPWVGWALAGDEAARCPFFNGNADARECAWPATLTLELDDAGGRFTQDWRVDAPVTIPLPGEAKRWPLDVRVDGSGAAVIDRAGTPMLRLEPGARRVSGSFAWDRLPEMLQIPAKTGIVTLTVRGRRVEFPSRDEQGRLWLQREQSVAEGESRLEVIVHRQVVDDVPLKLLTDVVLKVSGKNREVILGGSLPARFIPMSLTGPLPARVEADGRLRVQVRPGTWRLALLARHDGAANAITLPPLATDAGPWDGDEAWVFQAIPELRLVSVEGVPAIDAQQTELPDAWRALPAYLVRPGDTMTLAQRQRGDEEPAPDRLSLDRTWWLDFDGGGWTVQDRVGGTLSRSWRLEMGPETALGRVAVDGADQFITGTTSRGIEVRQTNVSLEADSRIEKPTRSVPAVSWNHDFESVGGRLHLPPGWRLLHAFGVDRANPTWIAEWDLLDLFLLLIIALAIGRLWGLQAGALAIVTLGLAWHEPGAPRWVWLFLLVGEALYRVLPAGIFKTGFQLYRWFVWGVLVLLAVPFLVLQVRNALYPQLEPVYASGWLDRMSEGLVGAGGGFGGSAAAPPPVVLEVPRPEPMNGAYDGDGRFDAIEQKAAAEVDESGYLSRDRAGDLESGKRKMQITNSYAPDPRAQVSTGPGLPSWSWREVSLTWRGPVDAAQRIRFVLVPPWLHAVLSIARTILVGALVLLVLGFPVGSWVRGRLRPGAAAAMFAALALVLALPSIASAQEPSKETLEELKRRLTERPSCAPACASIGRMRVDVTSATFRARLEISAAAETAVPLPGGAQQWSASSVTVDGSPARGLLRSPDGILWVPLSEGAHQVTVEGPLPDRETVQVPLPMKPRHVQASVSGWVLDGLHEDGQPDDTLQLSRTRGAGGASAELQQGLLPPFLRIDRTLRFDLSWQVTTRISRMTPPGASIIAEVPLIPGESVTSADVRVHDQRVAVSMGPTVSQVQWTSELASAPQITLVASSSAAWVEGWIVDASPIWHVEPAGIPPIQRNQPYAARMREWRPWPGEKVTLAISRPEGADGQTLTIDGASLVVTPGLRATDATLALTVRSSRGGQHALVLPEGAELQTVTVDGATQPVRQEDRRVTLPVAPGRHAVSLTWRQPGGIRLFYSTPKVELGAPAVNAEVRVNMPGDRWTLFLTGPRLGPAVLFWSLLAVYLAISIGLGRVTLAPSAASEARGPRREAATPLRWWEWFLLGLGLTQVPIPVAAIVAAWLLALGWRGKKPAENPTVFDAIQLALPLFTLLAVICLFASIAEGLLGMPEMQIQGNGSWATSLAWFQDRVAGETPRASILSVPLMVYRLAMLAWALWLAWSLLKWLRWGWTQFTTGGVWKMPPPRPPATAANTTPPPKT